MAAGPYNLLRLIRQLNHDVCDKADTSTGRKEEAMETGGEVEKVMCFCGEDREFGEMACCELHATGWYHFRCSYAIIKEHGSTCEEDFVCCFCLASKTCLFCER